MCKRAHRRFAVCTEVTLAKWCKPDVSLVLPRAFLWPLVAFTILANITLPYLRWAWSSGESLSSGARPLQGTVQVLRLWDNDEV